jgi:geranylgeranylglycerol-phosphate geranylgeranyltransferase
MSSDTLKGHLGLLRPLNLGIVFVTIAGAAILAGASAAYWPTILFASLAGALIAGGGNAINDYFDLEIDRINKPNRPLPRGAATQQGAKWLWGVTSGIGLLLSASVSLGTLAIAIFWVISLYLYSQTLKRTVLTGNILVGVMTGLAFVYGGVAVGHAERSFFPALFAFLINVARELVKDVEDVEGDAKEKAGTLPVKYGVKPALVLASLTIFLLVVATFLPYSSGIYSFNYLALVAVVDAALLYVIVSMWRDRSPANLSKLSLILKLDMVGGLIAIFVGS